MADLITPRTLSGFRDYLPDVMLAREKVLDTARRVYRSYGFTPIDTPACESLDVLLGKGGDESDKLVYRVLSARGDKAEMGLRFDLTVPFARFSAQYINQLGTPFKRYAMGPVWRGERPGQGRYREFWQCDFDTIGTTSNASDIETALVVNDLFTALNFDTFEIRINNRLLLNGLLELKGLADKAVPLLRSLDKLPKIGREKVIEEMVKEAAVTAEQAGTVLDLAETTGPNAEVLDRVEAFFAASPNDKAAEGIRRLRELLAVAKAAGVPDGRIKIDLSICRGLDYYTGTIYETFLTDLPGIGSVCSGGRYDNLASKYTKQVLPGVGASLGVDRLIAAMEELKHPWLTGQTTPAQVLVVNFDAARLGDYQRIASVLRSAGVSIEVYPEAKKVGQQFAYAEKRGFKLAVTAGPAEFEQGVWKVKDLAKREEATVPEAEVVAKVKAVLQ
ncbi:histidyl-trna synthetase : Histidine--tRNA ligase OS=Planctomyces limnophilus (strain ATCC 43296 / DSM 3776 / IFAM 1008 / 290) GN=hisS PE=3 SV=1: tRNA-synt_His: HGTP_anticodon [Gemmataceae bacterium]|nr:histidyl-trna synthetase : Histidine--tRNA ligase OS=Planctomyces limnophilus (strain ATCC 43296 / DSM 3776 / IFAM 1008 / 290) GN=hisS PE=3 SV=1: tRNA-synt_His: HGTP_anticodon [Gemmataceae bacterium]VTT97857.1 histidyl-trna synthetase : Histidine--tRNA ligase OS=Planctomyces limnophilus (strain ATCC 43296 / DSM 3776 / IFAM 1008 / 290) GN=hisS PE=3 SV=1: tRNA-synt_His: HGTP_anticodon [Gemmataceae bacterium]